MYILSSLNHHVGVTIRASVSVSFTLVTVTVIGHCHSFTPVRFGENALMKASHRGHPDVITTLIMDNADIKYENEFNGKTALHYAAEGNQPSAVKRLLEV